MPAVQGPTEMTMSREETDPVFGEDVPEEGFLYHDWRKDTVPVGTVPGAYCGRVSGAGTSDNRCGGEPLWVDGSFDLILSIGQGGGSP